MRQDVLEESSVGRIARGAFTEDVYSLSLGLNFSPGLSFRSFVQYDTDSESLGANLRLDWTPMPESKLYLVIRYNAQRAPRPYDTIFKLQHEFRF